MLKAHFSSHVVVVVVVGISTLSSKSSKVHRQHHSIGLQAGLNLVNSGFGPCLTRVAQATTSVPLLGCLVIQ